MVIWCHSLRIKAQKIISQTPSLLSAEKQHRKKVYHREGDVPIYPSSLESMHYMMQCSVYSIGYNFYF